MIYKMASKVLANMLKKILPSIISLSQSAFISGRLKLINNVIIAYKALHTMSSRQASKWGSIALSWTCPRPMIALNEIFWKES